MKCRPIEKSDYATACKWWDGHNFHRIPEDFLPSTGAIVEGYCLGWTYTTDSGVAFTGFVVGNPDKKGIEAFSALRMLSKYLIGVAKEHGCAKIFSTVKNKALARAMISAGHVAVEEGVTEMIYYKGD